MFVDSKSFRSYEIADFEDTVRSTPTPFGRAGYGFGSSGFGGAGFGGLDSPSLPTSSVPSEKKFFFSFTG